MSRERGYPPLDILQRIRRHYGCTIVEAETIFEAKGYAAVPPRGTGLEANETASSTIPWEIMIIGLAAAAILAVGGVVYVFIGGTRR